MKHKIYTSIGSMLALCLLFASCDSFINRPPFDEISDDQYWKNENHVRIYAYAFYPTLFAGYGTGSGAFGPFLLGQMLNDDFGIDVQADFPPTVVPEDDGGWNFTNVRRANLMIERLNTMSANNYLSDEAYKHWLGLGRFFRAATYSNLSFTYGDIPYFDRVSTYSEQSPVQSEKDYLFKDRDPRIYVDEKNIEDFRFAIENVRAKDGSAKLDVNKYVIAAYVSRVMLREGTFLKYHSVDHSVANKCLELAKEAAEIVMSGPYSISANYNALFSSESLEANSEVILYRKYLDGVRMHATLTYSYNDPQAGATKSLTESFLRSDGFPIYQVNPTFKPKTATDFFKDRDARLIANIRPSYYVQGQDNSPFAYSHSGFSWRKFMDDSRAGDLGLQFTRDKNVTDAPCLRLGEVLLNYAEACYELGILDQAVLNASINKLRSRAGVGMPPLEVVGNLPAVGGVVYDDPKRDPDVPALLWELRRERRVELCFEGVRLNDLKRWKKMNYMHNETNPDIRYGAYIRLSDYPKKDKNVIIEGTTEGYIIINKGAARKAAQPRNYINPIPNKQITMYRNNGYTLTQTKEWRNQ